MASSAEVKPGGGIKNSRQHPGLVTESMFDVLESIYIWLDRLFRDKGYVKDGGEASIPDSDDQEVDANGPFCPWAPNAFSRHGRFESNPRYHLEDPNRAVFGSVQSRLSSSITNIEVTNENSQAAQSLIRDVDYASETAKLATNRILTQAGVSVLTPANQDSDFALQLLRG